MDEKKTLFQNGADRLRKGYGEAKAFCRILLGQDLAGEEERVKSRKWRKILAIFTLSSGVSLLFSLTTLPFGISSLGYAFFAASCKIHAAAATCGILISLIFHQSPLISLFVILLGILMRTLVGKSATVPRYFEESRRVRCAIAASLGFLDAFARSALDGFTKESLFTLALSAALSPIFKEAAL